MSPFKLLLLSCILSPFVHYGQEYLPFPTENAVWSNALYTVESDDGMGYYYEFESMDYFCTANEDTLIGDNTYGIIEFCSGGYEGALRSEEGLVYFVPKDSTEELLLYDFTVSEGDTIEDVYTRSGWGLVDLMVESVSTVEVGGISRRSIQFSAGQRWIEGIGCSKGLLLDPYTEASEYGRELYCMGFEDTTLFWDGDVVHYYGTCPMDVSIDESSAINQIKIYPNPANDWVRCSFPVEMEIEELKLVNAQGQLVEFDQVNANDGVLLSFTNLPKGMYYLILTTREGTLRKSVIIQ